MITYQNIKFTPQQILLPEFINFYKNLSSDQIHHWFKDNNYRLEVHDNKQAVRPEFVELLVGLDLKLIPFSILFACAPNTAGFIHKDVSQPSDYDNISMQVDKNCICSLIVHVTEISGIIRWYNKESGEKRVTEIKTPYEWWPTDDGFLTERADLRTALIRTDVAHNVINDSLDRVRVAYTLRFQNNIGWKEVCRKLKDYIEF